MIISLTGFMGCGKSSVGRRLSELLCCPFIDLDQEIEKKTGKTVSEIFSSEGEAAFRQLELEALSGVMQKYPGMVLALGGGTVMTPECAEIVHSDTTCVYLRASADTLLTHLENDITDRPLLNTDLPLRKRITVLMAQRASTYEKTAHIIIDTDGKSTDTIASEIRSLT